MAFRLVPLKKYGDGKYRPISFVDAGDDFETEAEAIKEARRLNEAGTDMRYNVEMDTKVVDGDTAIIWRHDIGPTWEG